MFGWLVVCTEPVVLRKKNICYWLLWQKWNKHQ